MSLENESLPYMVGGLLYTPAINGGVAEKIEKRAYPCLTSMAFCLEDSIRDDALDAAEIALKMTLDKLCASCINRDELPLLFVRVRAPEHLIHTDDMLGESAEILTGYILPKFDLSNSSEYIDAAVKLNKNHHRKVYIMPVLESIMIAGVKERAGALLELKSQLDAVKDIVLNIRVGGNDFSNLYGLRRSVWQNVYQIGVIRDIMADIINVFAADYVVSGPVWEYFGSEPGMWSEGLSREAELDRLNGFIGKTAIHPSQLPYIYESMKVTRSDYEDSLRILNWTRSSHGVEKSADGSRMNEMKCHTKWASRIVMLAKIYGVRDA